MAAERPLVLVIGATGVMGREVMRSLAGRCRLRALVQSDMSDAQIARRYPQAERVQFDLLEAAAVLLAPETLTGPVEVTGPESLSFAELAGRLQAVLGRPIEHIDPDPAQWALQAASAGMAPWLADALAEYFEALRERPLQASDDTRRVTGRRPRSVEDFAADVLAPAMPEMTEPPLMATIPTTHRSEHA